MCARKKHFFEESVRKKKKARVFPTAMDSLARSRRNKCVYYRTAVTIDGGGATMRFLFSLDWSPRHVTRFQWEERFMCTNVLRHSENA